MPQIQTSINKEAHAELHYKARMQDKTLRELIREIILNYLEEDKSWQKLMEQKKANDPVS